MNGYQSFVKEYLVVEVGTFGFEASFISIFKSISICRVPPIEPLQPEQTHQPLQRRAGSWESKGTPPRK